MHPCLDSLKPGDWIHYFHFYERKAMRFIKYASNGEIIVVSDLAGVTRHKIKKYISPFKIVKAPRPK